MRFFDNFICQNKGSIGCVKKISLNFEAYYIIEPDADFEFSGSFQVQLSKYIVLLSFFLLYLLSNYIKELSWKNNSFYIC